MTSCPVRLRADVDVVRHDDRGVHGLEELRDQRLQRVGRSAGGHRRFARPEEFRRERDLPRRSDRGRLHAHDLVADALDPGDLAVLEMSTLISSALRANDAT